MDSLRTPTKIPEKVEMIKEDEAPPPVMSAGVVGGVPGGVPGGGQMGGVIGGIISSTPVAVPKVATPQRVRVSQGVTQGLVIRRVTPNYPPLAKQARIQGAVALQAEISKDGTIENLRLISGHPMLAQAAIEAVKQWRYKPYFLNGEPVRGRDPDYGELFPVRGLELSPGKASIGVERRRRAADRKWYGHPGAVGLSARTVRCHFIFDDFRGGKSNSCS